MGVLLAPFRAGTAHIVQLGSIRIENPLVQRARQISTTIRTAAEKAEWEGS